MSRLGLAILLVACRSAAAQEAPVLRARIARLDRALRVAVAAARRADSLERGALIPPATELVTVGALHVRTPTGALAETRSAAVHVWAALDSSFGTAAGALGGRTFTLLVKTDRERYVGDIPDAVLTTGTEDDIAQRLRWSASYALHELSDSALQAWLRGVIVPPFDIAWQSRSAYVELVTAPSPVARNCFAGDLRACRSALGLGPSKDALTEWYDAPRRRALVAELDEREEIRSRPQLSRSCVVSGVDEGCLSLLRLLPPAALVPPLSPGVRYSLVRTAVRLGGPDAYARLLESAGRDGPIADRLAIASGVSADSLLRTWRAQILAARPQPVTVDPRGAWMALGWGVLLGFLALRSTRWR